MGCVMGRERGGLVGLVEYSREDRGSCLFYSLAAPRARRVDSFE